ncbi:MAG: asparagine synthase (glutamine-hydrolyzing) [Lachnospiraceae bacterium]|nr:asparagine synthase (glutamine-hydrolyzing) [Lachnospiraceae bacterium]
MCGICGYTGVLPAGQDVLFNMTEKIKHRGPDSSGFYTDENISLGFRRLSIIDLNTGSQPMYNENKDIVIVFNGEIYNYKELKDELISCGHTFANSSDTEVLIHGYEEYGEKLLNKLRGMFAFAIWDSKNKRLFAARDFFGIKPFYYLLCEGNLVFGSEIKSILEYPLYERKMNEDALENYLTFQYSVLAETFFKDIFKLLPGHFMVYENGKLDIKRYYTPAFEPKEDKTLEETVNDIDSVMQDSIKSHKISDVEVGSFLSSGVDSSYVAACFKGDKTFTVGFDYDNYNEIEYAKKLSEKIEIDNYSKLITTEEYWEAIPKVQYHMDEPLADPSAIALYFVSQTAAKYVKVALSGEGADEFFGGYNIYREPNSLRPLTRLPRFLRSFLAALAKHLPDIKGKNYLIRGGKDVENRFIGNAFMFTKEDREEILKNPKSNLSPFELTKPFYEDVKNLDDITKMQYIDVNFWLIGDILLKADKMSMAHSLEVRVPFLDKEVFEVAKRLPSKYKVTKKNTKYAMRQAAHRYLPDFVAEKKKLGFPVPIRVWLKEERFYNVIREAFLSDVADKYFKKDKIISLLDEHKLGKKDNSRKIWTIYIFIVWYNEYFVAK